MTHAETLYERGVVTLTDERGKPKKKYFDGLDQLVKVQEFNGAEVYDTVYERDAAGSLITVTNSLNHVTRISYDMAGRKRAMCDPNMGTASNVPSCDYNNSPPAGAWIYTYNKAGDLTSQKDANYQTTNKILCFEYDALGRPTVKKEGNPDCNTGTTILTTWTYDDAAVMFSTGRVARVRDLPDMSNTITNFSYDALGRVTQSQRVLLGTPYNMSQSYDSLGRIKTETFPVPDNETVTYHYNEAGWLKSVDGYVNEILYNARGQKKLIAYLNGLTSTLTYNDPVDRPAVPPDFRLYNRSTSNGQQNLTYGYDPVGNVLSIADSLFTGTRTFTYDDLNRLLTASGTFGSGQSQQNCTYQYNRIGNLTDKCGIAFTYGYAMHPSAVSAISGSPGKTYEYDNNGNMTRRDTQTLTWNIDNRVTSISIQGGGTTYMEYDYTGQRIKKDAPGAMTLYPFKGYEIDPDGVITKFIKSGNETLASKKRQPDGTTTQYFYHNDHLGGVNVITDSTGVRCQLNEYDPWGGVSRSEGPTPGSQPTCDPTHRFTGQELDPETGLYYYGGRYYDQEISRFVSPDPYIQQLDEPQNLNRYSYVLSNPQSYVDPTGHFWFVLPLIMIMLEALPVETVVLGEIVVGGTIGAQVAATVFAVAWASSLDSALQNRSGLKEFANKASPGQSGTNVKQNTNNNTENTHNKDPGNDHPDEGSLWWSNIGIPKIQSSGDRRTGESWYDCLDRMAKAFYGTSLDIIDNLGFWGLGATAVGSLSSNVLGTAASELAKESVKNSALAGVNAGGSMLNRQAANIAAARSAARLKVMQGILNPLNHVSSVIAVGAFGFSIGARAAFLGNCMESNSGGVACE